MVEYRENEIPKFVEFMVCMMGVLTRLGWRSMGLKGEDSTQPLSTDELLKDHIKDLEAGVEELAVTGRAFTVLRRSDVIYRLLPFTRIYARFTPADKVLFKGIINVLMNLSCFSII